MTLTHFQSAIEADPSPDLAKMRDGTKMTRAGLVSSLVYQQQEISELHEQLAKDQAEVSRAWCCHKATADLLTTAQARIGELEAALKQEQSNVAHIGRISAEHHGDQSSTLLLHALTVDIPGLCEAVITQIDATLERRAQ